MKKFAIFFRVFTRFVHVFVGFSKFSDVILQKTFVPAQYDDADADADDDYDDDDEASIKL